MDIVKNVPKIILLGSPNVGKSAIFSNLTGRYVTVSNYPGTTVEVTKGDVKISGTSYKVIDTPGLYSIYPITDEERVTLEIIKKEQNSVLVHIVDAKNLERMLPLTFQLQHANRPIILVLNMFDELQSKKITIRTDELSSKLGIPLVATIAVANQGIDQLIRTIENIISQLNPASCAENIDLPPYSIQTMKKWYKRASSIAQNVTDKGDIKRQLTTLDKIIIHPLSGFLILFAILYLGLYKFVGGFGAGTLVNFFEATFQNYVTPWLTHLALKLIPWLFIQDLFVGEYGILTLGLRYAIAIILPIVGLFFLVFAIIEDSGYLPRLAYLLDSVFKRIGLSGRAVIPMVLGLGCDTMATMVVRTLATKREKIIATSLLSFTIPCSAQMGVIMGLLSDKPAVLVSWALIIIFLFLASGTILSKIMPGKKPIFVMEIPPMRVPQLKNIFIKTYARMTWYFKEIIPLFIIASLLIWVGRIVGLFDILIHSMATPLASMGLPTSAAPAFLFGFFRRDYGAAGLYDLYKTDALSNNQLLIAIVVLTLFLPCIAQLLIIIKERGSKFAISISALILILAYGIGVILHNILKVFSIQL